MRIMVEECSLPEIKEACLWLMTILFGESSVKTDGLVSLMGLMGARSMPREEPQGGRLLGKGVSIIGDGNKLVVRPTKEEVLSVRYSTSFNVAFVVTVPSIGDGSKGLGKVVGIIWGFISMVRILFRNGSNLHQKFGWSAMNSDNNSNVEIFVKKLVNQNHVTHG